MIVFLRNVESFLYRKQLFSVGQNLVTSLDREMHPHFLRKQLFILCQNLVASLYRNDSTFLKYTMGFFYSKMRFFRQCNLNGINSISVIDAPPGEFAKIASVIQTLYIYFSNKMADLSTRFT